MRRRTTITLETEETVVLRYRDVVIKRFCSMCGDLSDMATPKTIAILVGVGERQTFRMIEDGTVHFFDEDGIYVCLNSLAVNTAIRGKNDEKQ